MMKFGSIWMIVILIVIMLILIGSAMAKLAWFIMMGKMIFVTLVLLVVYLTVKKLIL